LRKNLSAITETTFPLGWTDSVSKKGFYGEAGKPKRLNILLMREIWNPLLFCLFRLFDETKFPLNLELMPTRTFDPDTLDGEERRRLHLLAERLRESGLEGNAPSLRLEIEGEARAVPARLAEVLIEAVAEAAEGRSVTVGSADEELTTGEAAELLNVSRPYLVELLEEGEIPFHKVGTHRRVRREDVLDHKAKMREEAEEAMQNLADQAQEKGLGY